MHGITARLAGVAAASVLACVIPVSAAQAAPTAGSPVATCSATPLDLLGNPLLGANGTGSPCEPVITDTVDKTISLPLGVSVRVGAIESETSPATASTGVYASTSVANADIYIGSLHIGLNTLWAQAESTLESCTDTQSTGVSSVARLGYNSEIDDITPTAPYTLDLGLVDVDLNQQVLTSTGVTQRAAYVSIPLLGEGVALAEVSTSIHC